MRNIPIDAVRGAVMVLMALDHVRYYFTDRQFQPEDLALTTLALFLTRWVTHFCAPAFFFLAGASASLAGTRPRKLVLRGVMLIVLELTVVGFAWTFRPGFSLGGVIWALGWSMILLALPALWKPALFLAIPVILFHELIPPIVGLHAPGMLGNWFVLYPLVPWFGVMYFGYAMGPFFRDEGRRLMLIAGFATTLAFAFLGADLNQPKYPPSVAYLLMTLGPMLVALAVIRRAPRWLLTFGRVPLFFYVAHLFVIHGAAYVVARVNGQPHEWLGWGGFFPRLPPDGYGYGLPVVWGVTALVVFALYWPCAWWERRRVSRAPSP